MRLDVRRLGAEQVHGASIAADLIDVDTATVAAAGITFGVFVRQHRADGLKQRR